MTLDSSIVTITSIFRILVSHICENQLLSKSVIESNHCIFRNLLNIMSYKTFKYLPNSTVQWTRSKIFNGMFTVYVFVSKLCNIYVFACVYVHRFIFMANYNLSVLC